jgi:hypothetical protein
MIADRNRSLEHLVLLSQCVLVTLAFRLSRPERDVLSR